MRRSLIPTLPLCVLLTACASASDPGTAAAAPAPEPAPVAGPADGGATCNNDVLAGFVGKEATQAVLDEARTRSGARHVRVGRPGMVMTMDFRQDRLTVYVNEEGKIETISCG